MRKLCEIIFQYFPNHNYLIFISLMNKNSCYENYKVCINVNDMTTHPYQRFNNLNLWSLSPTFQLTLCQFFGKVTLVLYIISFFVGQRSTKSVSNSVYLLQLVTLILHQTFVWITYHYMSFIYSGLLVKVITNYNGADSVSVSW